MTRFTFTYKIVPLSAALLSGTFLFAGYGFGYYPKAAGIVAVGLTLLAVIMLIDNIIASDLRKYDFEYRKKMLSWVW